MFTLFNSHITFYTSYLGFNYVNTIGFILISLYMIQLVSGLQLSLYYNYSLSYYAFDSIQFIMKDVNIGSLIRISHIIGSSFYMFFLWLHLLRGLFIKLFFYSFILSVNIYSFGSFRFSSFNDSSFTLFNDLNTDNARFHFLSKLPFSSLYSDSFSSSLYSALYSALYSNSSIPVRSASSLESSTLFNNSSSLIASSFNSVVSPFRHRSFVNRIEVSFVNSFYFTFYYVYFIGILIFAISIAVSFIGYTLVFGNLSYYGVIVILGIVSSVPVLLSYLIQFLFLFFSFLLILFIISFLFL